MRDLKIEELNKNIVKLEKDVLILKEDNVKKDNTIKKCKEIAVKEIKRAVKKGVTSEENVSFRAEVFVNNLEEEDISTDSKESFPFDIKLSTN